MNGVQRNIVSAFSGHFQYTLQNSAVVLLIVSAAFYANGAAIFGQVSARFGVLGLIQLDFQQLLLIGARYSVLTLVLATAGAMAIFIVSALCALVIRKLFSKPISLIPDSFRLSYGHFFFVSLFCSIPILWVFSATFVGSHVARSIEREVRNDCNTCKTYVTGKGVYTGRIIVAGSDRFALFNPSTKIRIIAWEDVSQVMPSPLTASGG